MSRKRRKAFLNRFGDRGFDALQKWFCIPDIAKAERRGETLGKLWHRIDRKHRERCGSNLALAFPEMSERDREKLTMQVFLHFGRVAADFLRSPIRTNEEVLSTTTVDQEDLIALAEGQNRGIIAVTAHFGNWERFSHWCTATGRPIAVVARDANQSGVQQKMQAIREKNGMVVLSRGNAARGVLQRLRNRELVGLLPDQNTDECFVPFFGKPAGTVLGPAVLHQRTGAILLPAYYVRTGVGQYRLILKDPVDLENQESDPKEIMAQLNSSLESVIREYPEQWLWVHDRWKESRLLGML
jgi:KDO2-lipid IV(A) lauroyltransferase